MTDSPIWISMQVAAASIAVTFGFGILAARLAMLCKKDWQISFWDSLLTLPLVLPPTVAGFFLLQLLGVNGPVGRFFLEFFGVKIVFSKPAAVTAAVVMSFPLMYRSARGAFEQVDEKLLLAARTLGLSEWQVFWRVLFPNARAGILSGGILAFCRGLGEFGATAMVAGNIAGRTRTLPLAVYSQVAAGNMREAYRYVAVLVVISFAAVFFMSFLGRQKNGRCR